MATAGGISAGAEAAVSENWFEEKKVITLALARRLLTAAERVIGDRGWSMYVAFTDDSGTPILVEAVNRPQAASYEISVRKAQAASRFRRPTKVWEERVKGGSPNVMSLPGVVASEGGVPLVVGGAVVGAVGVSGGTGAEDGVVARAVTDALAEIA
jgi:glc operon protein GlcG